jgi:deoxyribonuclease V
MGAMWPANTDSLVRLQKELAGATPQPWTPGKESLLLGGCWVSFRRGLSGPGGAGDPAWAAAVTMRDGNEVGRNLLSGGAEAAYQPGLLALRIGRLLEGVVRGLGPRPDVLLLDASGPDHPRRAGLALQLGAVLGMPAVGITHRPLLAEGKWPDDRRGATSPLRIDGEVVASWLRTQPGVRPLVVHPGWSVDLDTAVEMVIATTRRQRTPEPLRRARQIARLARNAAGAGSP